MLKLLVLFLFFLTSFVDSFSTKPWVQRLIGAIDVLEFDPSQSDFAYVASEQGVLAAINVKTGKLRWRQNLPGEEKINKMVVHKTKLVTLSAGRITRVWKTQDGDLVWEDGHYDENYSHGKEELGNADIQLVEVHDSYCVLTMTVTGEIRLRGLQSAKPLWDVDHSDHHHTPARAITVDKYHDHIFTVAFPEDSRHLQVTIFRTKDGSTLGSRVFELHRSVATKSVLFKGQYLVMMDSDGLPNIDVMYLDAEFHHTPSFFETSLPPNEKYKLVNMVGTLFAIQAETVAITFQLKGNAETDVNLKIVKTLDALYINPQEILSMAVGAYQTKEGDYIIGSVRQNFDGAEFEWYDVEGKFSYKQMVPFYDHEKHGDILRIFPHVSSRGQSRAIVISEDYALTFAKNGKSEPAWVREESLSFIKQLKIVDLPVDFDKTKKCEGGVCPADELEIDQTFASLPARLTADLHYFVDSIGNLVSFGEETDPEIFGVRKLIIALSESGKLFGIDSLNGKILMRKFLPRLLNDCKPIRMFQMKDLPTPVFAIVASSKDGSTCHVIHFDVVREVIVQKEEFPTSCDGAYRLPFHSDNQITSFAILNENEQKLHIVPQSIMPQLRENMVQLVFHKVDYENGRIQGFGILEDRSSLSDPALKTWPAWSIDFGKEEEIIHVSVRTGPSKVADTLYRPGGNRRVMYKYLNPHMIVVVTQVKEKEKVEEDSYRGAWFDGINVYLVDTISGKIIEHVIHQNAIKPVAVLQFENRIVYSFWNREKQHNVVCGLSLWHVRKISLSGIKEDDSKFSSYITKIPEILSKAWVFPTAAIKGLSLSNSRFGFGSKAILAHLSSGQIYNIDPRFVDPRQVDGDLKAADKEEGLMQYTPNIPVLHTKFITQGNEISRLRGVVSGPAKVESTSLVVAFGIDLFATLTTPAPFDMLNDDFDHQLLGLIVFGVMSAIVGTRYLAKDTLLRLAWQ